jgi:histidyl-tRNA synthetase
MSAGPVILIIGSFFYLKEKLKKKVVAGTTISLLGVLVIVLMPPLPFKRYQIQNVYRADNTQKGRYREFLQVDADIVGSYSPISDAEVIAVVARSLEKLGFKDYKIFTLAVLQTYEKML